MKVEVTRQCPMCGKINTKEFEVNEDSWTHYCCYGTKLIQEYFPDLSASEREFIKTGYCDNCQNILFAAPEDEDDEDDEECMNCNKEHAKECTETNCMFKKYLKENGE